MNRADNKEKLPLDSYTMFQVLMSSFSSTNYTRSEFFLILNIIDSLGTNKSLSIEELSSVSGVSMSSISRFIKKLGFDNYADFRVRMVSMIEVTRAVRKAKFGHIDALDTTPIFNNINQTKETADLKKIRKIIKYIRSFEKRLFIGSVEDLSTFSPLRKDLFACGYPCYLFYDLQTQIKMLNMADNNTCIILPTVNNVYVEHYRKDINTAKKHGAGTVLFTQSLRDSFSDLFDFSYKYGEDDASNFGFYSLHFLARILIEELHNSCL